MDDTHHHRVGTADDQRLKALPATLAAGVIALPVAAGLLGTLLPAIGILPAIGGRSVSAEPFRILFSQPGLAASIRLTLVTGLGATALSLLAVALFVAAFHQMRWFGWISAATAPVLAMPHVALAIGLLATIAPSGLLVRLLSPWATGWHTPPDLATVNDEWGMALLVGLALKEAPFLLLMTTASLNQIPSIPLMAIATSLGQPAPVAWLKVIFPLAYRQIRLPVMAVLAYAMSAVDVALLLGPSNPPPLANLVVRWFFDPDLQQVFPAAAAACLLLALTLAAILAWTLAARIAGGCGKRWAASGIAFGAGAIRVAGGVFPILLALAWLSMAAASLWSIAGAWSFPNALPARFDLTTWRAQLSGLATPVRITMTTALAATFLSLLLSVATLEAIARHGKSARPALLAVMTLPLLVPQAGFLFGLQVGLLGLGLDGGWIALIWTHLVFVLPYVLLSLASPFSALDPRLVSVASCLGASPTRILWAVKLPILLRPLLAATAIGMAVSAGQYLATLFAGGGRMATLATEAVTLASGGDRRVLGVYATVQAALPLMFYLAALLLPHLVWRHRAALRGA